jgi:Peptidase family S41/Bacteroidetes, Peptidase, S41 family, N-terminal domain/PDZ domain
MLVRNLTLRLLVILCCSPVFCFAQLTTKQKTADFRQLVAFYERQYAPAEWKKQVFGFDLFDAKPWLERVAKSKDDLEFYEICAEYVASLNDTHSSYRMPSGWSASLGIKVDSYEGSILIEAIDRTRLPVDQFPFQIGDELVSVDGVDVESWIRRLSKWVASSNPQHKRAVAAGWIVERTQSSLEGSYPRAPMETRDSAVVKIQRQTGAIETYTIKWQKNGVPVLTVKPLRDEEAFKKKAEPNPFPLRASAKPSGLTPGFVMPPGFEQRLGGKPGDRFYSGVFSSAGLRIGYLRISSFPLLNPGIIAQFAPEIAYLEANTDGLVVDIMHNGGGSADSVLGFYSYLSPQPYQQLQAVWRPTLSFLKDTAMALAQAIVMGDEEAIAFYQTKLQQAQAAYEQGAALTPPFPLIGTTLLREPAKDDQGNVIAYTKPIMLLTDTITISAADAFAATFQDNQRGIIFGTRTNGAGGNLTFSSGGSYSQGEIGAEININVRNHVVNVPGYPPTSYFDSVGVHPDIHADLMTKENLLNRGASFSQAMVAAITNYIQQQNQK